MATPPVQQPVDPIKQRIQAAWDVGAHGYDDQYGHGLKSEQERQAWTRLLRRLLPPEEPRRVLDVGTGTGFLALPLAELGHEVTGIDISNGMLAVARAKAARAGLAIDFRVGDADAPPFADDQFDVVISRHVLWTLLEPERAIRQWIRVVSSGGRVLAIDGLWHSAHLVDRAQVVAGRALRAIVEPQREKRHGYAPETRGLMPLMDLPSPRPTENAFARAGLRNVRSEELAWLDAVERSVMPLHERLLNHYKRYLAEGDV